MLDLLHKIKIYGLSKSLSYAFQEIYKLVWMRYFLSSYSQQGEDLVIDELLGKKKRGFYVDVGAHDPIRFSNTKRFYDKGWKGINIDPNPALIEKFKKERNKDINLALGVSKRNGLLEFSEFFPSTLSTFSEAEAEQYVKKGFKIISKKKVRVATLSSVLNKYRRDRTVDFLSIDTEGNDLEVLQSNDWKKFKPSVICVESRENFSKIETFLRKQGYKLECSNGINSIFSVP